MASFFENLSSHKAALKTAADLTAANAEFQTAIESLTTENATQASEIITLKTKLETAEKEKETAVQAQKDFDSKVEKAASAKALQIAGNSGSKTISDLVENKAEKTTRSEFAKLGAYDQMQFCKNGGVITE